MVILVDHHNKAQALTARGVWRRPLCFRTKDMFGMLARAH